MSKRAGTFVTLGDVVERGRPRRRPLHHADPEEDAPLYFDFDKVVEQSRTTRSSTSSTPMPALGRCWPARRGDAAFEPSPGGWPPPTSRSLDRPGRARFAQGDGGWPRQVESAWWRRTSRTAWPSTSTIWPRISTRCGTRASSNPGCASCCRRTGPPRGPPRAGPSAALIIAAGLGISGSNQWRR